MITSLFKFSPEYRTIYQLQYLKRWRQEKDLWLRQFYPLFSMSESKLLGVWGNLKLKDSRKISECTKWIDNILWWISYQWGNLSNLHHNTQVLEYFHCPHTTIPSQEPFWHIWKCEAQFNGQYPMVDLLSMLFFMMIFSAI